MIKAYDVSKLRAELESNTLNPKEYLLGLIELHNSHLNEKEVQDLLIRCLEKKKIFGDYSHILDKLVEARGLYPYVAFNESLESSIKKSVLSSGIKNEDGFDKVFHIKQLQVYKLLEERQSIILSAPTSFGKTLLVESLISSDALDNIVIVVPTISLIDELKKKFHKYTLDRPGKGKYKIVTQVSQQQSDRNIFLFTQERVIEKEDFPKIDFFVVDEFYKLSPYKVDDERGSRLNIAFKKLLNKCDFFYLLGPNIKGINPLTLNKLKCRYIDENEFITVATNEQIFPLSTGSDELKDIQRDTYLKYVLSLSHNQQTIIYCKSPKRASQVAKKISELVEVKDSPLLNDLSRWLKDTFHPEWSQSDIILNGICSHHAKLPRSIASLFVDLFNRKEINILVCTSTLIEGVNTNAKNIVIYDDCITRREKLDAFSYNNIAGRSGRMFEHFVGNVFFFGEKPNDSLNQIDIPIISNSENVNDSLLLHYDEPYTESVKGRLNKYFEQNDLSIDVLVKNSGIPPEEQLEFARDLITNFQTWHRLMSWNNMPSSTQLGHLNKMAEKYFRIKSFASGAIKNDVQLTRKIVSILKDEDLKDNIDMDFEYFSEENADFTIDDAVLRNFDFRRKIIGHYYPLIINAINNIQSEIFKRFGYQPGNYKYFISRVESMNTIPALMTLEEYGIPISLSLKANQLWHVKEGDSFDEAMEKIKKHKAENIPNLKRSELYMLKNSIEFL